MRAVRALLRATRSALDSLAVVLLPSDCGVRAQSRVRLTRIPVCSTCPRSLERAHVSACSICGEALDFAPSEAQPICRLCRRAQPEFDFAVSFGAYDGGLRKLIYLLKYEQLRSAANILGAKQAQAVCGHSFGGTQSVLLIPVPLHRIKRRQRGFNQSELIARSALRHLADSHFEFHVGNRQRVRATFSQTGLTGHRTVLLIDDVYTTGTTLNEFARVPRKTGARRVVATVARVYRAQAEMKIISGNRHAAALQTEEKQAAIKAVAG